MIQRKEFWLKVFKISLIFQAMIFLFALLKSLLSGSIKGLTVSGLSQALGISLIFRFTAGLWITFKDDQSS